MKWNWLRRSRSIPPLDSSFPDRVQLRPSFELAFSVLDLDARVAFRSATSISFKVEWNSHDHESKFRKGWIDVHYPCEDFRGENSTRIFVRVSLNEPYPDWESQKAILQAVFRALNIPEDVTYEALFFTEAMSCEVVKDPNAWFVR